MCHKANGFYDGFYGFCQKTFFTILIINCIVSPMISVATDLIPKFSNTGFCHQMFQQLGKKDSFRKIIKRSASKNENTGSKFFRTITVIQQNYRFQISQDNL